MHKSELKKLIPSYLEEIKLYQLGKTIPNSDAIRLNRNENLFISREIQNKMLQDILLNFDPRRYGGVYNSHIIDALANHYHISNDQVYCGNGSDELIYLLCKMLLPKQKQALLLEPTFGTYQDAIHAANGTIKKIRLTKNFQINPKSVESSIRSNSVLFFIDSPNNPSGRQFSKEEIQHAVETFPGYVILDEAYAAFAPRNMLKLLENYENLIIIRTFSKDFGFAGLRLGYAFASPTLIQSLKKFWQPYNVTTITQEAAIAILKNAQKYGQINQKVIDARNKWFNELSKIPGVTPYPSDANFILFRVEKPAFSVFDALLEKKIIVRDRSQYPLCKNCLRVTIGPEDIRKTFMAALKEIMKNS